MGRPRSADPKTLITFRIDPDIIAHYRATGPGWQTRINAALRASMTQTPAPSPKPTRPTPAPKAPTNPAPFQSRLKGHWKAP